MLSWLAGKIMAFTMRRLNAGDIRPVLAMDNPDVALRFPGTRRLRSIAGSPSTAPS